MNTQLETTFAAAAGLALAASSASAAVLVNESFSGSNGTSLVGTTTSDGNNWTGTSTIMADGSLSGSNSQSAYLSLGATVVTGEVYTIDITYATNSETNTQEPLRIGFSVGATGGQTPDGAAFDMFVSANNNNRAYPDTSGSESSFNLTNIGLLSSQIVLDTTNGAAWRLDFNDADGTVLKTFDVGTGSAFNNLWIGHERTNGTLEFNSITVSDTQPVPEPSSVALLGLGGLALILRRRR